MKTNLNIGITPLTTVKDTAVLYKITADIYKLDMPPVTSVFFLKNADDFYLVDSGQSAENVRDYIIPAASYLNFRMHDVKGIMITHNHWDHIDGLPALLSSCPKAKVFLLSPETNPYYEKTKFVRVSDAEVIDGFLKVIALPGHADDCIGFLDMRTKTLFPGDAVQLYGIADCGILMNGRVDMYISSMKKLLKAGINNILASHPYVPCGAFAFGAERAKVHIETSLDCINDLIQFTQEEVNAGSRNVEEIKQKYIAARKIQYDDFPTDGFSQAIQKIKTGGC